VVHVPEVPGARAWGATRWLTPTRPLIQLSLRYKTDDHLWFTFFHEAGHILLHGKRELFIEGEKPDTADEREQEANKFAADWLIPPNTYEQFIRRGDFSATSIRRFAHLVGIAPGIVVGRLQYEARLPQDRCTELKRRVEWN
jgi:Zn-dependent peptidase ImmA (M78 family)